ncbi:MAG: glycine cleavage system aminomethyltransferase GcvT, partial [Dehalococcoidales bacterium]
MKRSPLYEEHLRLGAKVVEFGGWEMPLNYTSGILAEHLATRKFGGLFDVSHMGRFRISGQDALPFMQYVLTNNAAALEPGQSQYTIIPNEGGGAVDDSYLYRVDEEEYLLVVNAANTEKDWIWLQKCKQEFPRLILEDRTTTIAMLSLQGPGVKAILEAMVGDIRKLPEPVRNRLVIIEIFGAKVPVARTGYTGEPISFELFPPVDVAVLLYRKLLESGKETGIVPAGLGARDTLRLEAGLPLFGHELGNDVEGKDIPVFALPTARFAVSFSKVRGKFIGRQALMKQFREVKLREEGLLSVPKEKLLVPKSIMPISISGGGVARPGCPVYLDGNLVGHVTSGTMVPYWKSEGAGVKAKPGNESDRRAICLAYLDADLKENQKTKVAIRDRMVEAIIVERHIGSEAPPYARPLLVEGLKKPVTAKPKESMEDLAKGLVRKARDNTIWRQRNTVNLIPSEQTPSPLVRLLTITDPSGRYAEHRRIEALGDIEVYYYQGTEFIAKV